MEFVPFTDNLLPAAAELLAERQRRQREQAPRLPAEFEDPDQALRAVEAAWQRAQARGAAAVG
ncbi:MAG TPA: hypothetical protein VLS48_04365, partial [Anaerolineales bacterium]|nr:hypothetical protein [Anaerolineales bacterium]